MLVIRAFITVSAVILCCKQISALPQTHMTAGTGLNLDEFAVCEQQVAKYRRLLLQAILSFEDVCDAYNSRPTTSANVEEYRIAALDGDSLFKHYQPTQHRVEIWAFLKLLMAQFNDVEFTNIIHDAVIERCRVKSQLQRDEKRNSVVLGKKQRFHSWGGKRAQLAPLLNSGGGSNSAVDTLPYTGDELHSYY